MSELNFPADSNIDTVVVTLEVFQDEISPLNNVALVNIFDMSVTFAVFHELSDLLN